MGTRKQKVAGARRGTKSAVKASPQRTSKLTKAASKVVNANSVKIAESLLQSTIKGHVQSARLLLDLAERPLESGGEAVTESARSQAEELAAEPEWTGEADDEDAASDGEGLNPEG